MRLMRNRFMCKSVKFIVVHKLSISWVLASKKFSVISLVNPLMLRIHGFSKWNNIKGSLNLVFNFCYDLNPPWSNDRGLLFMFVCLSLWLFWSINHTCLIFSIPVTLTHHNQFTYQSSVYDLFSTDNACALVIEATKVLYLYIQLQIFFDLSLTTSDFVTLHKQSPQWQIIQIF